MSETYSDQSDFLEQIRMDLRNRDQDKAYKNMLNHAKFFTIITLKQLLRRFLYNLYDSKDYKVKIASKLQIILLPMIQQQVELMKKSDCQEGFERKALNQFSIDFIASIIEALSAKDEYKSFIKPYKKFVIEVFNHESFFSQSRYTLIQWQRIIKCICFEIPSKVYTKKKDDEIFLDQLKKWKES